MSKMNLLKNFMFLCTTIVLCLFTYNHYSYASVKPEVLIDGKQLDTTKPIIINNRTMVEFRPIFEELGLDVTWNPNTRQVTGQKRGLKIEMTVGSKNVILTRSKPHLHEYSSNEELPIPVQIVDGRTLVPLRFVAESTYSKVEWDNQRKTASISTLPNFCSNPSDLNKEHEPLKVYLEQNDFRMSQEKDLLFYDNSYINKDLYIVKLGQTDTQNVLFIGFHDNERHLELGAEIAVRNGFPSTKDNLLKKLKNGRYANGDECNGVTYTVYTNNVFNLYLAWDKPTFE